MQRAGTRELTIHPGAWRISFVFILISAFFVALTGYATVRVVPAEQLEGQKLAVRAEPIAHVYVLNWGWYLFKWIPFLTGDLENPGTSVDDVSGTVFGKDNVRMHTIVEKLMETSKGLGGNVVTDLRTNDKSGWMPWTLIFWLEEREASANVSRMPGPVGNQ